MEIIDLTGQKFGKLTVIKQVPKQKIKNKMEFIGNVFVIVVTLVSDLDQILKKQERKIKNVGVTNVVPKI